MQGVAHRSAPAGCGHPAPADDGSRPGRPASRRAPRPGGRTRRHRRPAPPRRRPRAPGRARRSAGSPGARPARRVVPSTSEQRRARQGDDEVAQPDTSVVQGKLEEIHARRAEEPRDEAVRRLVVHLPRRRALLKHAAVEHGDTVAHGHGLDLVMSDVERRDAQAALEPGDLGPRLDAQLGIEVGERLVEQEHAGLPHECAAHGDALPLPAGERRRPAIKEGLDLEQRRGGTHPASRLVLRRAGNVERERHVLGDVHVWVERVVLEHHRDVPLLRRHVGDVAIADRHPSAVGSLEAGEQSQRRRLAAARWPDQDQEFAVVDLEVEAVEGRTIMPRKAAGDLLVRD